MKQKYCKGDILTWRIHNGSVVYSIILDYDKINYTMLMLNNGETAVIYKKRVDIFATKAA